MAKYLSSYGFHPERKEWVGVIYTPRLFGKKLVHTVGCMDTEQGIKLWLARVLRTRAWETNSEPADKYTVDPT